MTQAQTPARDQQHRPHGFIQPIDAWGRTQWICGWCGGHAQHGNQQGARDGLSGHLWAEHGVETQNVRNITG